MAKLQTNLHDSFRPCRDYIIAMIPLVAMACYLYGARPLILVGISMVVSIACDVIAALLRGERYRVSDISSLMFALVFTIMLPASVSWGIVIVGTMVTVLLGKHAFGGYGCYPFSPAAFGFAFVSVCWPNAMFLYPKTGNLALGWYSNAEVVSAAAGVLKHGGVPDIDRMELILGNYPGPMGATFCIIILSALALLIAHGAMTWQIPTTFLATCAVWAFLFPRAPSGPIASVGWELFSGALIFAAVFIVSEPTTAPSHPIAKLVYGALLGIGTMMFRTYGAYEMGICFAVLLVNPLASYLDRIFAGKAFRTQGGRAV